MTFSIPWDSLIGGMLLGISATLMLLMNGKIAGISGILTGLLTPKSRILHGDCYLWLAWFPVV